MRGATAAMGLALTLVWSLGLAQRLHADEGDNQAGRAVRLSNVNGQVQVSQGGQMLGDHAIANTPLFEGAQVTTGNDGRAEVQFEDGSVARIPPASSLTLSVLRPNGSTEILLSSGMGYFELQGGGQGSPMRVRFGSDVVTATGFTVLRVKLDDGPPNVAVFSGNAHWRDREDCGGSAWRREHRVERRGCGGFSVCRVDRAGFVGCVELQTATRR